MRFTSVAVFAVVVAVMTVASASGCLAPTQLTIEITTDVKCPDVKGTNVTIGNLGDVEAKPPTTETTACDPAAARIGSIVVVGLELRPRYARSHAARRLAGRCVVQRRRRVRLPRPVRAHGSLPIMRTPPPSAF